MSRINAWKPKSKFTAGLNVSQEEWDRIFKPKKKRERKHKLLTDERSECKSPN